MRLISAVLAVSFLANCQLNSANNNENEKKDTMSATAAKPSEPAPNTLTDAQKAEGWQLLFDGTTTKGWHVYNKKSDGSAWKVADGTLYLDTAQKKDWQVVGGGDIVTDEEFENYHFKVEWKVTPGGNSGLIFNIKEDPKYEHTWHTGPEMQVLDNAGHRDASINKHRAGDLYDLIASSPETVKPAGEWNLAEIVSNKGSLEFYLNGTKVVSTTMWDDNWKKMIAGSKFKSMPAFGTFKQGRLGLQDHGDLVWFRNIMIKRL
ncbi:MAG TPA: DUF1080 domain-containing protein [Chitinophagaceae bacterium]|nr:DUF1080 domain-containing protein [Chitinophagaceae bacterium]